MKRLMAVVTCAIALALPAGAQAWTSNHFYSPSGNIECKYFQNGSAPYIGCVTFNDGYVIVVGQYGRTVAFSDDGSWGFSNYATRYVLQYGQTYTTGHSLRCRSQTNGMRCWSTYSGHGFLLSRASVSRW